MRLSFSESLVELSTPVFVVFCCCSLPALMGLFAGMVGATSGVLVICYSRALRKVALFSSMRFPPTLPLLGLCVRAQHSHAQADAVLVPLLASHLTLIAPVTLRQNRGSMLFSVFAAAGGLRTNCCRGSSITRS
jgi:hypothetical protein